MQGNYITRTNHSTADDDVEAEQREKLHVGTLRCQLNMAMLTSRCGVSHVHQGTTLYHCINRRAWIPGIR